MFLMRWKRCKVKGCKSEAYLQDVYRTWHNVECFNYVSFGPWSITWVRNWWVCTNHNHGEYRFHDIDGVQKILFYRRKH